MKTKEEHIKEKQDILIQVLVEKIGDNEAIFGIPKEIAIPLIKKGLLHSDTYKYTGGCVLHKDFKDLAIKLKTLKMWNNERGKNEQNALEKFYQYREIFKNKKP